jgi:hypothetical protein
MIKSKQYNLGYIYNNYRTLSVSNTPLFVTMMMMMMVVMMVLMMIMAMTKNDIK